MSYTQEELHKLWEELGDIPINENEELDEDFHIWEKGRDIFDVWHWFDKRFEKGLVKTVGWE